MTNSYAYVVLHMILKRSLFKHNDAASRAAVYCIRL